VPFQIGDKIVCISNEGNQEILGIGEVYTITECEIIEPYNDQRIWIEEDEGNWDYNAENFILMGSPMDTFQRESIKDCVSELVKSVKRSKNADPK
jgi:hypothetical protein